MRNRWRGEYFPHVAAVLSRNYDLLREKCQLRLSSRYGAMDATDIFHETIVLVTHDARCANMCEYDIIHYFIYRHRMVSYQMFMDENSRKQVSYADDIQARETDDENGEFL